MDPLNKPDSFDFFDLPISVDRFDPRTVGKFKILCKSLNKPDTLFKKFVEDLGAQFERYKQQKALWIPSTLQNELSQLKVRVLCQTGESPKTITLDEAVDELSDCFSEINQTVKARWELKGLLCVAQLRIPLYARVMGFNDLVPKTIEKLCDNLLMHLVDTLKYRGPQIGHQRLRGLVTLLQGHKRRLLDVGFSLKRYGELLKRCEATNCFFEVPKVEKQPLSAALASSDSIKATISRENESFSSSSSSDEESCDEEMNEQVLSPKFKSLPVISLKDLPLEELTELEIEGVPFNALLDSFLLNGQFNEALLLLQESISPEHQLKYKNRLMSALNEHCDGIMQNEVSFLDKLNAMVDLYDCLADNQCKLHALFYILLVLISEGRIETIHDLLKLCFSNAEIETKLYDYIFLSFSQGFSPLIYTLQLHEFLPYFNYKKVQLLAKIA
jgi:hypothetical protein